MSNGGADNLTQSDHDPKDAPESSIPAGMQSSQESSLGNFMPSISSNSPSGASDDSVQFIASYQEDAGEKSQGTCNPTPARYGEPTPFVEDWDTQASDNSPSKPIGKKDKVVEDPEKPESLPVHEGNIETEQPKINFDLGKEFHFVKLPNVLSCDPQPFDPETYEYEETVEEVPDDEEGLTRLKLKVENTIRWRMVKNKEGKLVPESNAKFVRWSDGTMSLYLGEEIFDVHPHWYPDLSNQLFMRQGMGLQAQGVFKSSLTFRPHNTASKTHQKLTMAAADKAAGRGTGAKFLNLVDAEDPEVVRKEKIKHEQERIRDSDPHHSKSSLAGKKEKKKKTLSESYLEKSSTKAEGQSSDDESSFSIAAIKDKCKKAFVAKKKLQANNSAAAADEAEANHQGPEVVKEDSAKSARVSKKSAKDSAKSGRVSKKSAKDSAKRGNE